MDLELVPLLHIQRELYALPRGLERFGAYLRSMLNPAGDDVELAPLAAMNPMGKEHCAARVEALLASGVQAFERRERDRARAEFAEVLRVDPHNTTAQEFMERLEQPDAAAPAAVPFAPPADDKLGLDLLDEELPSGSYDTPLMPPDAGAAGDDEEDLEAAPRRGTRKAAPAKKAAAAKSGRKLAALPLALVALLILGAAGWFVWSRMGTTESSPAATQATLARASSLARAGKYDQAIALLQEIKPGDPEHDRALEMMADLQQKRASSAQLIDGRPAAQFFDEQLAAAHNAFTAHDYAAAKRAFEQAMRVRPLPPPQKQSYDIASQQVAKLSAAQQLFQERKYAEAVANLQSLREADPENKNILRMISDAHFNLGATALQEERLTDAIREFDEVLKVDPNDELARRSRDLAQRYDGQPKDLLYRIYVKYLPLRQPAVGG